MVEGAEVVDVKVGGADEGDGKSVVWEAVSMTSGKECETG